MVISISRDWCQYIYKQMQKKVILITDGACIGNPGPGGWACILRYGDHKKELDVEFRWSGAEKFL